MSLSSSCITRARTARPASPASQSLRGSGDFFAWADSLLHVRRHRGQLLMTVEHRGAPAPEPIELALAGDEDVHLEVIATADDAGDPRPLDQAVLSALADAVAPT